MGLLRLGFLANFLSHPVISGFITASGIQIAAGQLAPVLGIHAHGESFVDLVDIDGAQPRPDQSLYRGDRLRVAGLSLLGAPRPQAPPAPLRARRTDRGHPGEDRPGRGHRRDHRRRLGLRARRARRQDRRHGPQGPAQAHPAAVRAGALDEASRPRAADLHRGLRGVDLGRPDARRQTPPARRPRPGTDRARRCPTSARPSRADFRSPAASRARW